MADPTPEHYDDEADHVDYAGIAARASAEAVAKAFAAGLPVAFLKNGRPFRRFPDGREEPVSERELKELLEPNSR